MTEISTLIIFCCTSFLKVNLENNETISPLTPISQPWYLYSVPHLTSAMQKSSGTFKLHYNSKLERGISYLHLHLALIGITFHESKYVTNLMYKESAIIKQEFLSNFHHATLRRGLNVHDMTSIWRWISIEIQFPYFEINLLHRFTLMNDE